MVKRGWKPPKETEGWKKNATNIWWICNGLGRWPVEIGETLFFPSAFTRFLSKDLPQFSNQQLLFFKNLINWTFEMTEGMGGGSSTVNFMKFDRIGWKRTGGWNSGGIRRPERSFSGSGTHRKRNEWNVIKTRGPVTNNREAGRTQAPRISHMVNLQVTKAAKNADQKVKYQQLPSGCKII